MRDFLRTARSPRPIRQAGWSPAHAHKSLAGRTKTPEGYNPLANIASRNGDASCANAHVSGLSLVTGLQPSRAAPCLLHLQRQYGNRYVQRVLALTAKANGADFSRVRVHSGPEADTLSRTLGARAFTTGRDIFFRREEYNPGSSSGRKLLAHEVTHVVQQHGSAIRGKLSIGLPGDVHQEEPAQAQPVQRQVEPEEEEQESVQTQLAQRQADHVAQRTIMIATGAAPPWREMRAADRRRFLRRYRNRWGGRRERQLAPRILADMASATDELRYDDEDELAREVRKRLVTSVIMVESQVPVGERTAFAYPFRGASRYWGPRVNYEARDYWTPPVPDNYSLRRDPAKRRRLTELPSGSRCTVYNDPCGTYEFRLSPQGRANPYRALAALFAPQPPHKKTLIHCDYLVSMVHYRAFADSLGQAEFNRRVQAGTIPLVLRWNGFADIEIGRAPAGATHLRLVQPSRREDLIIGDHVYFFNHKAYDPLIAGVGGVWRLENAVLVDRGGGVDYFLGHGSGYRDEAGIKGKLLEQYNNHVDDVLRLIRATGRGSAADRARAQSRLVRDFPRIVRRGSAHFIVGTGIFGTVVDVPLRRLRPDEIPGLYDPRTYVNSSNPGPLYNVRRPVESR